MALLLDVPFVQKEEAKALGARWNPERKKWYATDREDYPKFRKWIVEEVGTKIILCDYLYVMEGRRVCYKCKEETRVIAFGIENFYGIGKDFFEYDDEGIYLLPHLEPMPPLLLKWLQETYNYRNRYSNAVKDYYMANGCDHCDALQGDFYLFEEVDSPFFVEDEETAEKLTLHKIGLEYDIAVEPIDIQGFCEIDLRDYAKIVETGVKI